MHILNIIGSPYVKSTNFIIKLFKKLKWTFNHIIHSINNIKYKYNKYYLLFLVNFNIQIL